MARLPISPAAVRRLLREIESSRRRPHILAIGGADELVPVLQQQFFRGGADRGAVRAGGPEGADVYVHVLAGEPGRHDEAVLRRAWRARVPAIAVAVGPARDDFPIPYVLATDIVVVRAGRGFPLEAIARAIAGRLGEHGAPLAGRIPLLRETVCDALVESFARRNAVVAAAVWIPGADLPVLTLNQLRLVLRLAQAYGEESGPERLPELVATLGFGFGLRSVARGLLDLVPIAGWTVKSAVAYGGTLAVGEAARQRFELAPTPPRAATGPAAP
jgi:uncharacterized protein (DUF697 family)